MDSGIARTVRYDSTSNDDVIFGTGLGCNGIIDVFVEPVTATFAHSFVNAVTHCHQTRQPGAIATVVAAPDTTPTGQHAFLTREGWVGSETLATMLVSLDQKSEETFLFPERPGAGDTRVFIQSVLPPWQLVIFGGWLDVVPLVRMAHETGFQVIVVDPRSRATSLRAFAEADSVLLCAPADALSQIRMDERTVAVLMNHNFEHDQAALAALAQLSLPFVGMLGPKRRQQKILDALKTDGIAVSGDFLQQLHGPVGLDIGAKTPEEIALSIVAEILAVTNGRNAAPIRDRNAPLHGEPAALAYA
jgi:xanthine/CO dehydrogenase XdhC/CoxF family maturation factor